MDGAKKTRKGQKDKESFRKRKRETTTREKGARSFREEERASFAEGRRKSERAGGRQGKLPRGKGMVCREKNTGGRVLKATVLEPVHKEKPFPPVAVHRYQETREVCSLGA